MSRQLILGLEGGGTKTDWVLLEQTGNSEKIIDQGRLPAANFRLVTEESLLQLFHVLPSTATYAGIFLAGCVTADDRVRLCGIAERIWPQAKIVAGSDRDSGFAAAFRNHDGIAVISGTGSAVTGHKGGKVENAGGRGHLLGDRGGGYIICLEGLRLALRRYDLEHQVSPLAESILAALMLNRMEDLIAWTQSADKMAISQLTPVMFTAAANGDPGMLQILEAGATSLAEYTRSVAHWLNFELPPVKLLGGVFLHQPFYVGMYVSAISNVLPTSSVELCTNSGALGAAWLAGAGSGSRHQQKQEPEKNEVEELTRAATEQVHPRSVLIDQMNTAELIKLFVAEESSVTQALESQTQKLEQAVEMIADVFRNGGRLFYVGAGTSGRLGALDASEIPPTFGESPDRVQAIMAGGPTALHTSVEGAEDDQLQGAMAVVERGVTSKDAVCGITASGRTPFVLSALISASKAGARTILLTCNPERDHSEHFDLEIDLPTGPELITGSTRLKAGTATKVALNILSTCALIRVGKVRGNWMIGLNPSNFKLRERAIRIVSQLKNISSEEAEKLLEEANWQLKSVLNV